LLSWPGPTAAGIKHQAQPTNCVEVVNGLHVGLSDPDSNRTGRIDDTVPPQAESLQIQSHNRAMPLPRHGSPVGMLLSEPYPGDVNTAEITPGW
jgi:hypothetical protein